MDTTTVIALLVLAVVVIAIVLKVRKDNADVAVSEAKAPGTPAKPRDPDAVPLPRPGQFPRLNP